LVIKNWAANNLFSFVIEEKSSRRFIGSVGINAVDLHPLVNLGYWLRSSETSKGYATEAARRALQAAYEDHGWTTAASVIAISNTASVAVAERLGATIESEQQNRYGPVHVYRHLPPASLLTTWSAS
jgi:RimJ/RimL family protein N-acetyltransferase